MTEAQAIQADSVALQEAMQETSANLQMEVEKCSQPPNPLTGATECDPSRIQELTAEMDGHRTQAEEIGDRASDLGAEMQVHSEEAQEMAAEAEALAADAEQLKDQSLALKDAAMEERLGGRGLYKAIACCHIQIRRWSCDLMSWIDFGTFP